MPGLPRSAELTMPIGSVRFLRLDKAGSTGHICGLLSFGVLPSWGRLLLLRLELGEPVFAAPFAVEFDFGRFVGNSKFGSNHTGLRNHRWQDVVIRVSGHYAFESSILVFAQTTPGDSRCQRS